MPFGLSDKRCHRPAYAFVIMIKSTLLVYLHLMFYSDSCLQIELFRFEPVRTMFLHVEASKHQHR